MNKQEMFEAWADQVGLIGKSRDALRLIELEGASINGAAREVGAEPSTVSRAHAKYRFGVCPCCGQAMQVGREEPASASR